MGEIPRVVDLTDEGLARGDAAGGVDLVVTVMTDLYVGVVDILDRFRRSEIDQNFVHAKGAELQVAVTLRLG